MSFEKSLHTRLGGNNTRSENKRKKFSVRNLMTGSALAKGLFASIVVFCSAAQAQAQTCTPALLNQSASSFEGRDSTGSAAGFNASNLQVGDFIVYRDVVIAGYNPAARLDIVVEITGINLNSAMPPASSGANLIRISTGGTITIDSSPSVADPYVTFRMIPMLGGSVTSDVASGTVVALDDAIVSLQDIDSNTNQNTSDVGGFLDSNPGTFTTTLTDVAAIPFQNGGGPTGFTTFTATPTTTPPPNWTASLPGSNLDHFVDISYSSRFTGGEFLHGQTGSATRRFNRGGVFGLCGTIAPAELTSSKSIDNVVANADGSTSVTYTITAENTGEQSLTGLVITDDLDTVFNAPYDGFIPSTASVSTGGVTAIDAFATILTDTGNPIGSFPTNPSFNGGSDVNIFDPSNTTILDPGDRIQVSLTLLVEPNTSSASVGFVNEVEVTATDEFMLSTGGTTASDPINFPSISADLSLTKTNTPSVNGDVDQAADELVSGSTTTYTVMVTNGGPATVTGAVVTDTVGAGLTCTGTDPVTLSGDGVPAGNYTISDLTGAGITLATLTDGQSTTITYSCEVN